MQLLQSEFDDQTGLVSIMKKDLCQQAVVSVALFLTMLKTSLELAHPWMIIGIYCRLVLEAKPVLSTAIKRKERYLIVSAARQSRK